MLLLLTGIAAWWLEQRPGLAGDAATLRQLPPELAGWQAVDIPMEQDVADMLRADENVQRAYIHPQGYVVFVYVGYYGTARGGTPEHTPEMCYPAQGWSIVERDSVSSEIGGEGGFAAREFVVEKDGQRHLVHFWYRTAEQDRDPIDGRAALESFLGAPRLRAAGTARSCGSIHRSKTGTSTRRAGSWSPMDRALESALATVWPTESVAEPGAS